VEQGFAHSPVYVQRFFDRDISFAETAVVFSIGQLMAHAVSGSGAAP
jgi:hypothetical protein